MTAHALGSFYLRYETQIRFLFSGTSAAVFQLFIYIVSSRLFGLQYLVASTISFVCALMVSFLLQKYVTFKNRDTGSTPKQFLWFALVALINLALNGGFMYTLVDVVHFHDVVGQVLTMILIAIWSFFIYKYFIFRVVV